MVLLGFLKVAKHLTGQAHVAVNYPLSYTVFHLGCYGKALWEGDGRGGQGRGGKGRGGEERGGKKEKERREGG